ncbi:MAG: circularly permuted type 2 ATP-grasp protein [Desulfobacteraceae bacterium]
MNSSNPIPQNHASSSKMNLCHTYAQPSTVFDELWTPDLTVRKHWQTFIDGVQKVGCEQLGQKHQEITRRLKENGVAYNIHGDPQGVHRHWQLDAIPLIVGREDWQTLCSGLEQRALLLELILKDLYGSASLITEGLLPPALIYGHGGFLRPCRDDRLTPSHRLFVYSADLARSADGSFNVLSDRTQMPYGIGHTIENRTAMANVMPELIRGCKVQRLSTFFRQFRDGLAALAPNRKEQPRIVIYASAPSHQGYFEQAYLGGYLNYTVAQGEDLTIRNGRVWLKTLYGLKQVDAILRMRTDRQCDPLELDPTVEGGLAGLLEAVRQGHVVVANPMGSGVLENPGLIAYLPAIARKLLDQELILPSLPTWWCGDPAQRRYVLDHLHQLIIKPIFHNADEHGIFGAMLTRDQQEQWRQRIEQHPHRYVGQAHLELATAPSIADSRFKPLHTVLRTFTVTDQKQGFETMPGGIARSAADGQLDLVNDRSGGILKDLWVIADTPQKHASLWMRSSPIGQALRRQTELPSRTAENLFWVGRYAERAELLARMLRTVLLHLDDSDYLEDENSRQSLKGIIQAIAQITHVHEPGQIFEKKDQDHLPYEILAVFIGDDKSPSSLLNSLDFLFNAAQIERERWSSDTWYVLNDMKVHRNNLGLNTLNRHQLPFVLNRLVTSLLAFSGLCMESMSRELGWVLLDIGRRLERALMMGRFMQQTLAQDNPQSADPVMMELVLKTTENMITYRRRYRSYLAHNTVLDLLLMDDKNPRSLIFQLDLLQSHIAELPKERGNYRIGEEERLVLEAVTQIRLSDTDRLCEMGTERSGPARLMELLDRNRLLLEKTSDAISRAYFIHTPKSRQLSDPLLEQSP